MTTPASEPVPEGTPETDALMGSENANELWRKANQLEKQRNAALQRAEAAERELHRMKNGTGECEPVPPFCCQLSRVYHGSMNEYHHELMHLRDHTNRRIATLKADLAAARAQSDAARELVSNWNQFAAASDAQEGNPEESQAYRNCAEELNDILKP